MVDNFLNQIIGGWFVQVFWSAIALIWLGSCYIVADCFGVHHLRWWLTDVTEMGILEPTIGPESSFLDPTKHREAIRMTKLSWVLLGICCCWKMVVRLTNKQEQLCSVISSTRVRIEGTSGPASWSETEDPRMRTDMSLEVNMICPYHFKLFVFSYTDYNCNCTVTMVYI